MYFTFVELNKPSSLLVLIACMPVHCLVLVKAPSSARAFSAVFLTQLGEEMSIRRKGLMRSTV